MVARTPRLPASSTKHADRVLSGPAAHDNHHRQVRQFSQAPQTPETVAERFMRYRMGICKDVLTALAAGKKHEAIDDRFLIQRLREAAESYRHRDIATQTPKTAEQKGPNKPNDMHTQPWQTIIEQILQTILEQPNLQHMQKKHLSDAAKTLATMTWHDRTRPAGTLPSGLQKI